MGNKIVRLTDDEPLDDDVPYSPNVSSIGELLMSPSFQDMDEESQYISILVTDYLLTNGPATPTEVADALEGATIADVEEILYDEKERWPPEATEGGGN